MNLIKIKLDAKTFKKFIIAIAYKNITFGDLR